MKRKIYSVFISMLIFLYCISPNAYAQEEYYQEIGPIYNVVVPTSYHITVDPNLYLDKASMITSPEYYIINKSSVPIQMDIAFKLISKDSIILDVKNSPKEVEDIPQESDIWFAAAFHTRIIKEVTEERILTSMQGETIYQYWNGEQVIYSISPRLVLKERVEARLEQSVKLDRIEPPSPAETASGSAITVGTVRGGAVTATGSAITTGAVSGAAITAPIMETSLQRSQLVEENSVEAVSGGAITASLVEEPSQEVQTAAYNVEVVSCGAITAETIEEPVQEVQPVANDSVEAVSGSAITLKPDIVTLSKEEVKSTPVQTEVKTGFNNDNMNETNDNIPEALPKEEFYFNYTEVNGVPVIYNDTRKVYGYYGKIGRLDESSPNIIPINYNWNIKSLILEGAALYPVMNNSIITGETAKDNKGVSAFRFIGTVSRNTKWSETELGAIIQITFKEYKDSQSLIGEIATDVNGCENTAYNNKFEISKELDMDTNSEYILPKDINNENIIMSDTITEPYNMNEFLQEGINSE